MNCKHLGIAAWLLLVSLATAHTAAAQQATNRPLIRHVFVDLQTDTLFVNGFRFGQTPAIALFGLPDGTIMRLVTTTWENTAITAELPIRDPGNYKLVIITGTNKRDQMGVTISAEVPDQSCPSGENATGITDGILDCAADGITGYEQANFMSQQFIFAGQTVVAVAFCPRSQMQVLGGGHQVSTPFSSSVSAIVTKSAPQPTSWVVEGTTDSLVGAVVRVQAFAICADR